MYEVRAHVKRNKVGFGGTNVAHGDAISNMVTHKYNDGPRGTECIIYNITWGNVLKSQVTQYYINTKCSNKHRVYCICTCFAYE